MPNIELEREERISTFRKIAIGTWRTEYDPSTYGTMTLHMDKAMEYIAAFREKTGRRLTVTHMMGLALTRAFGEMPDANAILRFHNVYRRKSVGIAFQVVLEEDGKADLSAVTLRNLEGKTLLEFLDEFEGAVDRVRSRKDLELQKARNNFKIMPNWLIHYALKLTSWLGYTLNLDMRWAGVPKDPFGSAFITNIGSLGLETAYVPLVPYSRCPLILAIGAVQDEPIVVDGEIKAGKVMRVSATFDHRIMDGAHASTMSRVVKRVMEHPFEELDAL